MGAEEKITEEMLAGPDYGAGMVKDPESGCTVLLWIKVHRDTYEKCDYMILGETPKELVRCLQILKNVVKDRPVVYVKTMKREDILNPLSLSTGTERYERSAAMAICALNEAFEDYLRKRFRRDSKI